MRHLFAPSISPAAPAAPAMSYTPCNLAHAMQEEADEKEWAAARKRSARAFEQEERDKKRRWILEMAAADKHVIVFLSAKTNKVYGWRKLWVERVGDDLLARW